MLQLPAADLVENRADRHTHTTRLPYAMALPLGIIKGQDINACAKPQWTKLIFYFWLIIMFSCGVLFTASCHAVMLGTSQYV